MCVCPSGLVISVLQDEVLKRSCLGTHLLSCETSHHPAFQLYHLLMSSAMVPPFTIKTGIQNYKDMRR